MVAIFRSFGLCVTCDIPNMRRGLSCICITVLVCFNHSPSMIYIHDNSSDLQIQRWLVNNVIHVCLLVFVEVLFDISLIVKIFNYSGFPQN